jgi:hypothetical protein
VNHATGKDIIATFPHPIFHTVQEGGRNQTIHTIRELLQANARAIDTHLRGGVLGHLGIIVSGAAYVSFTPTHPWENPADPGRRPEVIYAGIVAKISAAGHLWEENVPKI